MTSKIMPTYNRKPVTFTRGEGIYLYDSEGKQYLDALCGLAVTSLGHSHPLIVETVSKQSAKLIHTSNAFHIESQEKLAKRLCQLTGMENAFFCNSGAEAVEAAIKLYAEKYNLKLANVALPLRVALTGTTKSPSIFEVASVLGWDEVDLRIESVCRK